MAIRGGRGKYYSTNSRSILHKLSISIASFINATIYIESKHFIHIYIFYFFICISTYGEGQCKGDVIEQYYFNTDTNINYCHSAAYSGFHKNYTQLTCSAGNYTTSQ